MQLNITTDYAIRIVIYLALTPGVVSSREISEKMKIPSKYILKISNKLQKEGLINSHKGKEGGFSLAKETHMISLFEIITAMEKTTKINRCLEKNNFCSRYQTDVCPVRNFYLMLQAEFEKKLSSVTIEGILAISRP